MMILLFLVVFLILRNVRRFSFVKPNVSGNYLLLIAHPDDESMFFAPTLLNLKGKVRIFCLSDGGYMCNKNIRKREMQDMCSEFGFGLYFGKFKDNDDWNLEDIVNVLYVTYLLDPFKTLITFDSHGVSGHKNHISCHYGAKIFSDMIPCKTMFLRSINLISKYCILFDTSNVSYTLTFKQYFSSILMMSYHFSQIKWFRLIYMAFSNYMSYNLY